MMDAFKPHMEVLPTAQQLLWSMLAATRELGFVLYGGTAIALRLGHRTSVDFDFFSERALDRGVIQDTFSFMSQATVLQDERNALSVLAPSGDAEHVRVKVSFFGTIGFGRVGKPELTQDGVQQVASLDDLMATKVKVILQRAESKDYRDITAMLKAGLSLANGLAAARELFGPNFQPSESLKAMVYFEDGDLSTLSQGERGILVKAASAVRELPKIALASHTLT